MTTLNILAEIGVLPQELPAGFNGGQPPSEPIMIVLPRLVPGIHAPSFTRRKAWMAASSAAKTEFYFVLYQVGTRLAWKENFSDSPSRKRELSAAKAMAGRVEE